MNLHIDLVYIEEICTIAHVNTNEIECAINFKWDDISADSRKAILTILEKELLNAGARNILNKIA